MNIPQPKKRFMTRLGIPIVIIVITACLLLYASWNSIRSSTTVEAVTVVMRNVETDDPQDITDKRLDGSKLSHFLFTRAHLLKVLSKKYSSLKATR